MDDDDQESLSKKISSYPPWWTARAAKDEEDRKSGEQDPPPQRQVASEDGEPKSGGNSGDILPSLPTIEWGTIGDKISDLIVPDWVKMLPGFMKKLQSEMSLAPGSLAEEIWQEANDPEINPEIVWDCTVRVSDDLCDEEKVFLERRKRQTVRALARYLDIPESKIHPDDVPTIAMCGSGGGLRALVAGSASYLSSREAGLFNCITYTAGVSGSCWLQTLFYSSIAQQSHAKLIHHLKNRLGVHIAYPPAAFALINSAPTNKFLLSGLVEKLKGVPDADFGIVDLYGMLLGARLLVPKGELSVDAEDLKISNQRKYIDQGQNPLPIYTAVRHEIPLTEQNEKTPEEAEIKARKEAWFQWFEFTPYEFWCEELAAGIPTWAIGRHFENGRSLWRENGLALPELRVPLMMGIWGSAFCATLSHYYREIRPVMKSLKGFGGIDSMIAERDEDLVKVHPIDPATIPNFALGMREQLPASCPESIFHSPHLQLMDAGMSNNLPIYPILRSGRNVDIVIAFDASADVKTDNWLHVVDGYARQRGIKGWPIGAGWPRADESVEESAKDLDNAQAKSEAEAQEKIAKAAKEDQAKNGDNKKPQELGYCNVWVGTTEERSGDGEDPPSKLIEDDFELMKPEAGITVIYFPFLPNKKVEGVDPKTSDYLSTWNFIYTPEQIEKVVSLARANFDEGREQTKRVVRAVYERKKTKRLEREEEERVSWRRMRMRAGTFGKKLGEGDHADQFS
jgi:phospholipase A2